MCLREFGIWPFIIYCGVPGMDIPANMFVTRVSAYCMPLLNTRLCHSFEALQVKSVARRGLRQWANMENVLDMVHDYVFESAGTSL